MPQATISGVETVEECQVEEHVQERDEAPVNLAEGRLLLDRGPSTKGTGLVSIASSCVVRCISL